MNVVISKNLIEENESKLLKENKDLRKSVSFWKKEAIESKAKLGEEQIKRQLEKCKKCRYEDTDRCKNC